MRKLIAILALLPALQAIAQDSTMSSLTKDLNTGDEKKAVVIFDSEKIINANSTELVGKGKMSFRVTHNFFDIAGKGGGAKSFFGLDAATDVKIGFQIGLGNRLDMILARVKGAESNHNQFSRVSRILEFGLKYKILEQLENDPGHPVSMAVFGNIGISTMTPFTFARQSLADSAETHPDNLGDRMSQTLQLIIARKFNKVSLQMNATFVHRNRITLGDQNSIFALGFAGRIPVSNRVAFIVDWMHPFHSEKSEQFYNTIGSTNPTVTRFYDPLGFGVEITTSGHVFHLNFTNTTEILENRMIPRTVTSWGKGQFRWGFTIARKFVLWKPKK
jgi:hypothetical protein